MLTIMRAWYEKQRDGRIHYIARYDLGNERHLLADRDARPASRPSTRLLEKQVRLLSVS